MQTITQQFSDTSNLSQDGLQSAADDVRSATQTLIDDLKGLGTPDTASGQEVKSSIDTLSTTLDTETSTIEDTANGVSSIADVPSAITKISTSLSTLGTAFSQTLQTIEDADASGELQSALQDSPELRGHHVVGLGSPAEGERRVPRRERVARCRSGHGLVRSRASSR